MHMLGSLGQKVAELVNRAALDGQVFAPEGDEGGLKAGGPVHDHEFRLFQPAGIQIIDELTPGGSALATHIH